jgi:hypothetical protein
LRGESITRVEGKELYLSSFGCNVSVGGQSEFIEKHKFLQMDLVTTYQIKLEVPCR